MERKRIKTFLKFLYCVTQVYVLKSLKEKCFLELQEGIVPACLYSCKNCLTWISLKTENELMCFDLQGGQSCCFFPLCIKFSLNKEKGVGFFFCLNHVLYVEVDKYDAHETAVVPAAY